MNATAYTTCREYLKCKLKEFIREYIWLVEMSLNQMGIKTLKWA